MSYFLGIDTSTTSSKALLIDERGEVIAVASNPHTLQTPKPLWSEQDPLEWWQAVSASIKSVLEKACKQSTRITGRTQPISSQIESYRSSYAVYQGLYPALKGSFDLAASAGQSTWV